MADLVAELLERVDINVPDSQLIASLDRYHQVRPLETYA